MKNRQFRYRITVNHSGGIETTLPKEYYSTTEVLMAIDRINFTERYGYCTVGIAVYLNDQFVCCDKEIVTIIRETNNK